MLIKSFVAKIGVGVPDFDFRIVTAGGKFEPVLGISRAVDFGVVGLLEENEGF